MTYQHHDDPLAEAIRAARLTWRGGSDYDYDKHLADAVRAHFQRHLLRAFEEADLPPEATEGFTL